MGYPCVGREREGEREREREGERSARERETEGGWRERERERESERDSWDIRGKERDDSEGGRERDIKNVSLCVI